MKETVVSLHTMIRIRYAMISSLMCAQRVTGVAISFVGDNLLYLPEKVLSKPSVNEFLRASAILKHVIGYRLAVHPSVRPSVCLSHAGTVSKRLNILSCFLHSTIAHSF